MTENDIAKLEELPRLLRLECLMLANNKISLIEEDFAEVCPKLDTLILSNNRIARFEDIDKLASCETLKRLALNGNLVSNLPNYRLYVINKLPQLKVLDYQTVSMSERDQASKLYGAPSDQNSQEQPISAAMQQEQD